MAFQDFTVPYLILKLHTFQILIVFLMIGGFLLNIREEIPENPLADVNEIRE